MRQATLLVLAAVVASGCLQPGDVETASNGPRPIFVDPIVDEHDHASFEDHALWMPSMSLVGHHSLDEDGKAFSYIGEMDTHGDLTAVQVIGKNRNESSPYSTPGFVLVDTTDPADPLVVGRAEMPTSYVVDVKFSPDGKTVFATSQAGNRRERAPSPVVGDPKHDLASNGITAWDVSDPTAPRHLWTTPVEAQGCHMVTVKEIAGRTWLFCAPSRTSSGLIYRVEEGGRLTPAAFMATPNPVNALPRALQEAAGRGTSAHTHLLQQMQSHDITVQEDPKEPGRWLAAFASWDFGFAFYDVSDPMRPRMLSTWQGEDAKVYQGNAHGSAFFLHEGRRMILLGPELEAHGVPALWVVDVDDLAAPKLVAEWVPPGEHDAQNLLLTTHQLHVLKGKIYMSYNHAGVWVLDVAAVIAGADASDPSRPEVLGYYLPHNRVTLFSPDTARVPNTWDLNVKDGYILASDRFTGFYVIRYEGDAPGDPELRSFL